MADAKLVLDKEKTNAGEVSEEVKKLTEVTKKLKDTIAEAAKKAKEAEESKKVKQAEEVNQTGIDRSAAVEALNIETVTPARSARGRRGGPTVV